MKKNREKIVRDLRCVRDCRFHVCCHFGHIHLFSVCDDARGSIFLQKARFCILRFKFVDVKQMRFQSQSCLFAMWVRAHMAFCGGFDVGSPSTGSVGKLI